MKLPRPDDQTIVIFGASGDLTSRKLVPALWALHNDGLLPRKWKVIGYARSDSTDAKFRSSMRKAIKPAKSESKAWDEFASHLTWVTGPYDDLSELAEVLADRSLPSKRLFYASVPPSAYSSIVCALGASDLNVGSSIVIEKPFGHDLASAEKLNDAVHEVFGEDQVFRIDHYLGKETVQNILVFRFSNGMFEPIWNRRYVTKVEITVAETDGVGHRGGFYEEAGALRDIVQNHIFQVLTFLAMEPPVSFEPEALRNEKAKVLAAMRCADPASTVRGQYSAGNDMAGYRQEKGVGKRSDTETFIAMTLWLDNWRWSGVPFYVRTGKRLPRRVTEVTMTFQDAPHLLFEEERPRPNHLTLRIQPDEGICLSFDAKVPGPQMQIGQVDMDFSYASHFGTESPEAYERLLRDAMVGDHTLFPRSDEVIRAWTIIQPILEQRGQLHRYKAGTWGPKAATDMLGGENWHLD